MSAEKKKGAGPAAEPSILFEISQILDSSLDLRTVVEPVLEVITRSLAMKFATLTLLNRASGEISIESAYGLSASQKKKGRYKLGEGVTGQGHSERQARRGPAHLGGAGVSRPHGGAHGARRRGAFFCLRADQAGPGGDRRPQR